MQSLGYGICNNIEHGLYIGHVQTHTQSDGCSINMVASTFPMLLITDVIKFYIFAQLIQQYSIYAWWEYVVEVEVVYIALGGYG